MYIYQQTGRALGIGLAGLINILNLPLYVVGGGVAESWDLLAPSVFVELERRSYVYALTAPGRPASSGMPGGGTRVLPAKWDPKQAFWARASFPCICREPQSQTRDPSPLAATERDSRRQISAPSRIVCREIVAKSTCTSP
jgi:hypothetical protein